MWRKLALTLAVQLYHAKPEAATTELGLCGAFAAEFSTSGHQPKATATQNNIVDNHQNATFSSIQIDFLLSKCSGN
jgi:hypothetical protein